MSFMKNKTHLFSPTVKSYTFLRKKKTFANEQLEGFIISDI